MKKPSVKRPVCGTERGYCRHVYHKEETCRQCRDAHNVYMRDRKDLVRRELQMEADREQARLDALEALAHRHPEEFQALHARALAEISLS